MWIVKGTASPSVHVAGLVSNLYLFYIQRVLGSSLIRIALPAIQQFAA